MALHGGKAGSALYRNNHDGTFTDVTDKAGVGFPCWAMGASVGDYNNDGSPDLLVTCLSGVVLYRNNGEGTFMDATKASGLAKDCGWATGAAFGDYDGDGWADLFVSHYVDFHLDNLPVFGSSKSCKYLGIDCAMRPSRAKGLSRQSLSQQWRRDIHRCVEKNGSRRSGKRLGTDCDLVGF